MTVLMNLISVLGTFALVFGILYFAQRFTIGLLPIFKKHFTRNLSIGDITFTITSLVFIFSFVDFYKPY